MNWSNRFKSKTDECAHIIIGLLISDVLDGQKQDLLDSLCGFVEDNDTIYVQYKHYHFGFHFGHYGYFKEIIDLNIHLES